MSDYLFAYGTLQPGCTPSGISALAARLRPVAEGFVRGTLFDLGRYPGAIPDPAAKHQIRGIVLELPPDEDLLRPLDAYEGFDPQSPSTSEFVRELQTAELSGGRTLECWFYRYNLTASAAKIIEDGSWRGHRVRDRR